MIKFYEPCIINKEDSIFQFIKKINKLKNDENYYPVGIYLEKNKVIGILSLGDVRRIALKNIDFKKKVINYLNKKAFIVDTKLFNSNFNNKINSLKKEKKIDFVLTTFKKNFKIVKISDIENLQEYRKTCVIGLGHIGLPLLVYLSEKVTNISGFDKSLEKIKELKKGKIGFFEKNLKILLKQNLISKKINFDTVFKNVKSQNYVICVGSEIKKNVIDNKNLISICKQIGKKLNKGNLVVLRGTVQIGLSRKILIPILEKNSGLTCGKNFNFAYMPERIVEGDALLELKTLPQLVSGYSNQCKEQALNFAKFHFDKIIELSSLEEAEIIKLSSNAYRDLNFAFANEITRIASKFNLSGNKLIKNSNLGYTRNKISLPSIGVGGYCLPKDPILFSKFLNKSDGYILGQVSRKINNNNIKECFKKILKENKMFKNILILGATFKGLPETIDIRNSPSIEISKLFKKISKKIEFYDVMQKEIVLNNKKLEIKFVKNLNILNNFDLIILANNHPKYVEIIEGEKGIKFNKKSKKIIFDPWCLLNQDLILKQNWTYISL